MQIKISNEQHFQVLADQFTIGISESGYTLMFSADGFNFSPMFTVNADTNRLVTNVSNGTYYYLSGNTGDVIVNYMTDCGTGGGGGAAAGVSSINGQTGAVSLKTINNVEVTGDGNIDVAGGASNYNIVDELPTGMGMGRARSAGEPLEEGKMVFLKTEYGEQPVKTITMRDSNIIRRMVVFYVNGEEIFNINGVHNPDNNITQFWHNYEWRNDGNWHTYDYPYEFKFYWKHNDTENICYFYWECPYEVTVEVAEEGDFTYAEETVEVKTREGAQYIYSEEYGWKRNIYDLTSMSNEERLELAREIANYGTTFPFPIVFSYGDKYYRAANAGANYDGTENTGLSVWSSNGDVRSIVRAFVNHTGDLFFEEYGMANTGLSMRQNFVFTMKKDGTEAVDENYSLPEWGSIWYILENLNWKNNINPDYAPFINLSMNYNFFGEEDFNDNKPFSVTPIQIFKTKEQFLATLNDWELIGTAWTYTSVYYNPILEKNRKFIATSTRDSETGEVNWNIQFVDA